MIYLYVCTLGRSALGKAPKLEIITAVSSPSPLAGFTLRLLGSLLLPTECPGLVWGCPEVGVPGDMCPDTTSWTLPRSQPHSFLAWPESLTTLPIATNRKMHELANPKGEFIITTQGYFMHFKGWGNCQASKTGIVDYQTPSLRLIGFRLHFSPCFHEIPSPLGSM